MTQWTDCVEHAFGPLFSQQPVSRELPQYISLSKQIGHIKSSEQNLEFQLNAVTMRVVSFAFLFIIQTLVSINAGKFILIKECPNFNKYRYLYMVITHVGFLE